MVGIRQFDRRIDEGAAALVGADFELGREAQPGQQLLLRLAGMFPFDFGPGQIAIAGQFAQAFGDQLVLRFEMTIEGRLVRAGVLDDRVDTDGVYPVTIESQLSRRSGTQAGSRSGCKLRAGCASCASTGGGTRGRVHSFR
jgi:hypothetical protein